MDFMKVRVEYSYELGIEDTLDLQCYLGEEKLTRDTLRQLLIDLGKGGVEEQIAVGSIRRRTPVECDHAGSLNSMGDYCTLCGWAQDHQ